MKRLLFGLCLSTLGACVVDSPVAKQNGPTNQESQSAEEQLEASIPTFCAGICDKWGACPNTADPATCPDQCAAYMTAYLGHGDACVQDGKDFEACFQSIEGCPAPNDPPACDDMEAYNACAGSDPTYGDGSSGGSGASPGTMTGTAMGSGGSGGTAVGVDVTTGAYLQCDVAEAGGGYAPGQGTSTASQGDLCAVMADNCSDGSSYRLRCDLFNGALTCNCFKDGLVTGSFTPQTGCPPTYMETDAQCGWLVRYE